MAVARADVAGQQVRVSDAARAPGTKKRRQPFKTKVKKFNSFFLGTSCHLNVSRTLRIDLMCEWTLGGGCAHCEKEKYGEKTITMNH